MVDFEVVMIVGYERFLLCPVVKIVLLIFGFFFIFLVFFFLFISRVFCRVFSLFFVSKTCGKQFLSILTIV